MLTLTSISPSGTVDFRLRERSGVGILVQRVIGHHELLGRRVPTLKRVGRVPFGPFPSGHHHVHWDLRVNGRHVRRGTYQVTVRAVTRKGQIRDLGRPRILHVR